MESWHRFSRSECQDHCHAQVTEMVTVGPRCYIERICLVQSGSRNLMSRNLIFCEFWYCSSIPSDIRFYGPDWTHLLASLHSQKREQDAQFGNGSEISKLHDQPRQRTEGEAMTASLSTLSEEKESFRCFCNWPIDFSNRSISGTFRAIDGRIVHAAMDKTKLWNGRKIFAFHRRVLVGTSPTSNHQNASLFWKSYSQ